MLTLLVALTMAEQPQIPWRTEYVMELGTLHRQGHPVCEPIPNELEGMYSLMGRLGWRLMQRDRLAWLATDALKEAGAIDGITGWITDIDDQGVVIHWVRDADGKLQSVYEGRLVDDALVWTRGPGADAAPLPAHLHPGWLCRQTALAAVTAGELQVQHPKMNVIVELVDDTPYVFLVPPKSDDEGLYIGGVVSLVCSDGTMKDAGLSTPQMVTLPVGTDLAQMQGVSPSPVPLPTPGQYFQGLLHDDPMLIQAQGHAWYIVPGKEDHYLGALPKNEKTAAKRLKKLQAMEKTNQHR